MMDLKYGSKCKVTRDKKWEIRSGRHIDPKQHTVQWFVVPVEGEENLNNTHSFDNFANAERYVVEVLRYAPDDILDNK